MASNAQMQDSVENSMDLLDDMIAYEQGELSDEQSIDLFQKLIDNGLVWQLQGSYGRTAHALISAGICTDWRKQNA